jgi:hypothetical protein
VGLEGLPGACDAEGPGERRGAGVAAACGMGKVRGSALI